MTQRRLNSSCLLNIHSTVTDELNVERLMDVSFYSLQLELLGNCVLSTFSRFQFLSCCERVLKV